VCEAKQVNGRWWAPTGAQTTW